ncbi:MAG: CHASE4 domain-containing protein [Victivallales bacterium]
MKLRVKTLVYTGITLFILILLISTGSSIIILSGFNRLEEDQMLKNSKLLSEAIKSETARLDTLATDWGKWDESYAFIENKNQAYIDTNLQAQAIANLGVDIIVFIDNSQKVTFGTAFDPEKKEKIPLPPEIAECIESNKEIFDGKNNKDFSQHGILMAENSPFIFSACSILTSKLEGPSLGMLLFGNYIDKDFIGRVGKHIQKDFTIARTDRKLSVEMTDAESILRKTDSPLLQFTGGDSISVFMPFKDVHGKQSLIAEITLKRELYSEGKKVLMTFICGLVISGGILYMLIVFILEKAVLSKVRDFSRVFSRIRQMSDLSQRVEESGNDELGELSREINKMLATLEHSKTSQQYTEISMLNNEKRYQLIIDQAPIGIVTCYMDERFRTVNQSFCDIIGYKSEELLSNKKLKDITYAEDYVPAARHFEDKSNNIQPLENEKRLIRKDGKVIYCLMRAQIYRDLLGEPQYLVKTVQDITQQKENQLRQKKLEEDLRQAQQLESIGRLAGGFAHDLNNFLVPILAYTDMLLSVTKKDDPLYGGVLEIKNAAERAKTLSQKFLALSSKQMLEVATLDLNDLIKAFKNILNRLIREDIRIEYNLSSRMAMIKGDYAQIEQVVMNLAVNAKDAMPKGGLLTFETYNETLDEEIPNSQPTVKPGKYVVLKVTDTGTGISKEAMAHLFEAFFTTKERGKGTGLGLSMVHGIVNQHGGGIKVWSSPGKGTSFMIYLPSTDEKPPLHEKQKAPSEIRPGRGETVLIVEDEPSVLRIVSSELKRNGYNVIESESGFDALEIAGQHKGMIDILLTDVIMPGMDGKELYLKLSEIQPEIKVLYMSGHTYDVLSQHDIQAPDAQFISKPFSMDVLRSKLQHLLK